LAVAAGLAATDAYWYAAGKKSALLQPRRLTIALIQIGANGDVQPFDTG
jgi:hypothetical protein